MCRAPAGRLLLMWMKLFISRIFFLFTSKCQFVHILNCLKIALDRCWFWDWNCFTAAAQWRFNFYETKSVNSYMSKWLFTEWAPQWINDKFERMRTCDPWSWVFVYGGNDNIDADNEDGRKHMGYWPSVRSRWLDIGQVFACSSRSINTQKMSAILTEQAWSRKDLLRGMRRQTT